MLWWWFVGCAAWVVQVPEVPDTPPVGEVMRLTPSGGQFSPDYLRLVPPVPLPSSSAELDQVEIWVRLPDEGEIGLVDTPVGPRLSWPPGSTAARVEWSGQGADRRVVDVRGTALGADGAASDFVMRPEATGADAPLVGVAWPQDELATRDGALEWLTAFLQTRPPVQGMSEPAHARWRANLLGKAGCTSCHVRNRPDNTVQDEHGLVNRGTDATGWFTPATVFADEVPVERYGRHDRIEGSFFRVQCADGVPAQRVEGDWRCPERRVPRAAFDVVAARTAGDPHAEALCASRVALAARLSDAARQRFASALSPCKP